MAVTIEYPKKFTYAEIKTKTKSAKPNVIGVKNYIFRLKTHFEGISINPADGVISVGKKAVPGNYVLEVDCVDSVVNKCYQTKHIVFVRDPNKPFPGDDEISITEEEQQNNINEETIKLNQDDKIIKKTKKQSKNKNKGKNINKEKGENIFKNFLKKISDGNNKNILKIGLTIAISAVTLLID